MVGWHHRLNGQELGQTPGDGEGQGGLACGSPWGGRVGRVLAAEQQQSGRSRAGTTWGGGLSTIQAITYRSSCKGKRYNTGNTANTLINGV